jgi:hypothetical protein
VSILVNHITLMLFYAIVIGIFFAFLWKETRAERIKLFLLIFVSLVAGGIIIGWLMYPFPIK